MAFKVSRTSIPAAPSLYKLGSDKFYGVDSTTSDDNVSLSRACGVSYFKVETSNGVEEPGAVNFIRTNSGEIGKRCGAKPVPFTAVPYEDYFHEIEQVQKKLFVNGILIFATKDTGNIAALHIFIKENDLYTEKIIFLTGCQEEINWNLLYAAGNKIIIMCDKGVIITDCDDMFGNMKLITSNTVISLKDNNDNTYGLDFSVGPASYTYSAVCERVKIPIVFIGKTPQGEGVAYEPINMLTDYVCEQFQGDGASTNFKLSFTIESSPVVHFLNENGEWTADSIGIYGPNESKHEIVFMNPPPNPLVTGEDNIRIYYKKPHDSSNPLYSCKIACNYGVGGYKDRLFLSGGTNSNYIYYSAMEDYTYFPETSYLTIGDERNKIQMLSGQDTNLAVFTSDKCYLVSGNVNSNMSDFSSDAIFTITHIFESAKPIENTTPIVFNNELIYLSEKGIVAITPSNVLDERYAQVRSERINYWLLREQLEGATLCVCKDLLFVQPAENEYLYIFDGDQFSSTNSEPFSYRQYEAFVWKSSVFESNFIWNEDDYVYLFSGKSIYRIPLIPGTSNEDYSDTIGEDNYPVSAFWETPNIYGNAFYNKKSFSRLGILLKKTINSIDAKEVNTTVKVYYKKNNEEWKMLKNYSAEQCIFRYDYMNYALFSYMPVGKTYNIFKKIKIKKAQSLKLRFVNDIPGMPLYLQAFGLEYTL